MTIESDGFNEHDDDDEYDGDEFCVECGDEFHYDDTGGYNPPCACGLHCRSCHEHIESECDDDYERDEDDYPGDGDEEHMRLTERFWDGRPSDYVFFGGPMDGEPVKNVSDELRPAAISVGAAPGGHYRLDAERRRYVWTLGPLPYGTGG
jgi:hypothetical protein